MDLFAGGFSGEPPVGLACHHAPVALTDQLTQWRGWLETMGAPVAPVLKPGASRAEIDAVLGPDLPHAVLEWFRWCDGVEYTPGQTVGDSWAIPGYWPIELRDVVATKALHDDPTDPLLAHHWVPLLENGSSNLYAAVWTDTTGPVVVSIMPEGGPPQIEFRTVEQMVSVFNACFACSAYYLDDQHRLEVDDALYDEVYDMIVDGRPAQEI
ncbi:MULTISPECIES: hypothetical protein [unclassified Micromonospora]|uniref:hypothetical protein n=1 Tax=unclassified Micromonospora TaxID=2617518 RepID=UPI0033164E23